MTDTTSTTSLFQKVLEYSGLILGVVNAVCWLFGTFLRDLWRDRAKLNVKPINPGQYQWWFEFPGMNDGIGEYKMFGFLAYIGISNKGLRKGSIDSWQLQLISNKGEKREFPPYSISEPCWKLGQSNTLKILPVLGEKSQTHEGKTTVDSGEMLTGAAFYLIRCEGDNRLIIKDDKIEGKIVIRDIFGKRKATKIIFQKISLEMITEIVPDIKEIIE